jgi:hypothetical protein
MDIDLLALRFCIYSLCYIFSITPIFHAYCGEFFIADVITFALSIFKTSLLSINQSVAREEIRFDTEQNSNFC